MRKKINRFSSMQYKKGGEKQDWISNKIATLLEEDSSMSQKQAISIALSMSEKQFANGGDYSFNSTPNFGSIEKPKVQGFGLETNFQSQISPTSITAGEDFKKDNPLPEGTFQADPFGVSANKELETPKKTTENFQPTQFFNPYADVDLAQGMNTLGQSIENGDALGIVAGGLKTLTGTARNIFSGMGQARIKNEGMKNYYDAQRDNMIGKSQQAKNGGAFPNFQDGGNYKTTPQGLESKISETLGTTGEGKVGNSGLMGEIKLINKRNDGYGILYDTDEGDKYEVVKSNAFTGMQDLPELKRYKYKRGEYSDPKFLEDGRNVEALKRGWQSSGYNPSTTTYPESVEAYRAAIGKPSFYSQEQMAMAKQKSPQMVGSFQDGGEQQDPLQMVSEALQQGATEEQIAQILMQQGYSEEEIGQIFQQLQGQQSLQEGGEQQGQAEQIYQMVAEALQSGADPQQIAQQLISSGIPKEQVMQIIQEVMSQMQGMQQSPQEEQIEGDMSNLQEETTEMKMGGSFDQLIGKKILGYEYNKDKDTYSVRYE